MDTPELAAEAAVEAALSIPELVQEEQPVEDVQQDAEEQEEIEYPKLVEDDEEESDEPEEEAEEAEEEKPESNLPEGYVDVSVLSEQDLATVFKVLDSEGEIEIPNLEIEYKANGQIRKDRLDQVVKLAQWGVYNEDKDRQAKEAVQLSQQAQRERDEYVKLLDERERQIEKLLVDDDYLYRVRERYEQENSPESRAQRAEERYKQLQSEQQLRYIEQRGTQFYQSEVEPAIQTIADALPNVTADELAERMVMSLQPHLRQGPNGAQYIPEESYDAVRNYIVDDLVFWAQMQDSRRSGAATKSTEVEEAQRQLEDARVQAQKAKRAVGKKTRPVGKAQAGKTTKSQPINNVDDAVNSALDSVLAGI